MTKSIAATILRPGDVYPARRVACQCKTDEAVVVEPDGYRWSKDLSGKPCVGCELGAKLGMPCPEHGP